MAGFADYAELFIGRDPLRIARHVRVLEGIAFHARRYWPLEAAFWDIVGQACGQPVAALFGGALDKVSCYASFGESCGPAERAEAVLAAREAGFRAVKIRIGRDDPAGGLAAVRAARSAAGRELAIMVDLNQWWRMPGDVSTAMDLVMVRRIADELRELDVLSIGHALGGRHGIPHGVTLAMVLPQVLRFSEPVRSRRLAMIAFALDIGDAGRDSAWNAAAAIDALTALRDQIGLAVRPADFGVADQDFEAIAADALDDEVLANAPRKPAASGIMTILATA